MSVTIDFGIDLGTTNSLIAKYETGKIEVFKNSIGHKETLPSVVAFRKERIIIGDKAREYVEKDPENVFGSFKRKMGTSESFNIKSRGCTTTPIELSSLVLKELKTFVYTNEPIESVVITIPASFDTIQSNATKKAGYEAGFKEVVLLQEPIAASLAYANSIEEQSDKLEQWLVYDLGGGTFDVALVKTENGEMRIVDHEGDNFLGGMDFDNLIVENFIAPQLKQKGAFENLENELKSGKGKYNKLYYILLHKAEEAKVQLSVYPQVEIEFETEDDNGDEHEMCITLTRTDFENLISERIEYTIDMILDILNKNELGTDDIKHILMVGGSTYIPYVRQTIEKKLGISVNCNIDPTTAIAVGAAYYAGSKTKLRTTSPVEQPKVTGSSNVSVKMAFQKTTNDPEEYFVAELDGDWKNLFYRITREDGGYDSGLKNTEKRISEMLPLSKNSFNSFNLKLYDSSNNLVNIDIPIIGILQGKFNISGQPLPNDICIEIDDFENNVTRLEAIFEKNAILPIKKTITREISKTIPKQSNDSVIINIIEGDRFSTPSSNQTIGTIEVKGTDISRDLVKGSDVEVTLEISESRDLKITVYLLMTGQEFTDVFSPSQRKVNLSKLLEDANTLSMRARQELNNLQSRENYEDAGKMKNMMEELDEIRKKLRTISSDDVTDSRYQIEDRVRKLSKLYDILTVDNHIVQIKDEFFQVKSSCENWVNNHGTDTDKRDFDKLVASEKDVLASDNKRAITLLSEKFSNLRWSVSQKLPSTVIALFHYYSNIKELPYPDEQRAKHFVALGERAMERKNYEEVLSVVCQLHALLPPDAKDDFNIKGTGIG
jgi:molecular chaperone DnaK